MKQTTLTQRLLSALVALCMVLSVCAPALAANSSFIWIQKSSGYPTPVTSDNIGTLLPGYSIAYNGNTVTITMGSGQHTQELEGVTLIGGGQDLVLCTAGTNWMTDTSSSSNIGLTITGMKNVTVKPATGSSIGFLGSLKIVDCTGEVSLTAQYNRVVLGRLNIDNTAGNGGVTITSSHLYPLCNYAGGNTVIASNGPVKIENKLAFLTGGGTLVGPAVQGSLIVTHSSSVEVIGASGDYATIIGNADITSDGAVTITNAQGTAVGGELTVNAGGAVTVTGDTVDATKAAIAKGANITAGGSVNVRNSGGIAVDGGLTVNNTSGDVTVTSNGEYALKGITTITSNGAVNITSNGGQVSNEKLTVNKSSGVTVTAVSDGKEAFLWGSNYTRAPRFVNTPKVEIWNKGNEGWVGMVEYVPPDGMGSVYYTSSASDAEKHYARNTDYKYNAHEAYFRIESAALYTLTLPEGTAKTNGTSDTRFYAGELVTVTAPADTETTKFEKWTFSGTEPTGLPNGWETSKEFTFKMPAGNVTLGASYHTITKYEVKVTGGTIVDKNEPGKTTGSYLPGTEVKVAFTGSTGIEDQFEKWTLSGTKPTDLPNDWQSKPSFSFTMPEGDVTLKAGYKTVYNVSVADGKGTILVNGVAGSRALAGDKITVTETGSDKYHLFSSWQLTSSTPLVKPEEGWEHKPSFSFTMPEGNVTLTAAYKDVYTLTVDGGKGTILVNGVAGSRALAGDQITVTETGSDKYHLFSSWQLTSSTPLVAPDGGWTEENNSTSKTFTFKMPAGNVTLKADYKQLYDLTVTGGTIVDENGTGKTSGIYLPGTQVTVHFTESTDIEKQFKQWMYEGTRPEAPEGAGSEGGWDSSKEQKNITFTMPAGDVTLSAAYLQTYYLSEDTGKAEFFVNDQQVNQAPAGVRVTVKLVDGFINDHHEFDQWLPAGGMALVDPEDGWEHKPSFSFTMPEGMVMLKAYATFLYDVNVTHGTIVDGTSETGASKKIVKPGQLVTVRAESTEENPFLRWTYTGEAPVEPDDGWPEGGWQTSPEFTFKMPEGNVTLEAQQDQLYKVSINDSLGSVTINDEPRSSLWVKEGETVTVATTLKDGYWMEFMKWTAQDGSTTPVEPSDNWQTSTAFTFKMPNGPVELVAQWSASSLDPEQPIDPDEPLDEDFGVEPDTTGGTIAAVAVGGAAIWGGYEIATRVILHSLLPEGTVIPANRGQLALLVWNAAGRPEPAGAPAFADVADPDMAKAAQWCIEQGTMAAKGDRFEPEGWTPKFKVIEVWNKTFPAA